MSEVPLYSRFTVAAHILGGIHAQQRSPGSSEILKVLKIRLVCVLLNLRIPENPVNPIFSEIKNFLD